jgi:hypothetical protein
MRGENAVEGELLIVIIQIVGCTHNHLKFAQTVAAAHWRPRPLDGWTLGC